MVNGKDMHWFYRLQEGLHCTEREAILLMSLMGVVSLGAVLRAAGVADAPFDDAYYAESDSMFEALSRGAAQEGFGAWTVWADTSKSAEPDFPININTASQEDLEFLPGIGPKTAQKILARREEAGAFGSPDDLLEVSGIGPKTLEKLRPLVVVQDSLNGDDPLGDDGSSAPELSESLFPGDEERTADGDSTAGDRAARARAATVSSVQ